MPSLNLPAGVPKLLLPLAVVVGGVGMGALLMAQMQEANKLRGEVAAQKQNISQLEAKSLELTQQVTGLQTERKGLEERLASLRTQLSSATADLQRSRETVEELTGRYDQLSGERTQLETQVAGLTSEREEAKRKAQQLEQSNTELERAASRLRERLKLLDRDYRQLAEQLAKQQVSTPPPSIEFIGTVPSPPAATNASMGGNSASAISGSVELPPIIVRKDQAGMTTTVRGRLLDVNESHNFVVVDKGSDDGVRVGMVFDILRGAASVGRVSVVRVRPQLSACDVIRAKTPSSLQAGDTAVQSSP